MNANDRKKVCSLLATLESLKAQVEDIGAELREIADAEQGKYDNLSEGLQESDKGQAIYDAANYLSDAADAAEGGNIDDAIDAIGNIDNLS
jgi:chromosome segregation ATPase